MTEKNMNWMCTISGKKVYLDNPSEDDIILEDAVRALSRIPRFGGHTDKFFSVAQHSVLVASLCPTSCKREGLMHDLIEAYVGDVILPIKRMVPGFKALEERFQNLIAKKFNLTYPYPAPVKEADIIAMQIEATNLMPSVAHMYDRGYPTPDIPLVPYSSEDAYDVFMHVYYNLEPQHAGV